MQSIQKALSMHSPKPDGTESLLLNVGVRSPGRCRYLSVCDLLGAIGLQVALQGEQEGPVQRSQAFSSPQQGYGCTKQGQGGHEALILWQTS